MTPGYPLPRDVRVLADQLGVRPRVQLRPGREWTARGWNTDHTRVVGCERRSDVRGRIEIHWCDAECPTAPGDGGRWRLRTSALSVLGCADTFAAACDLIAVSYGLAPGGYGRSAS